MSLRLSEFWLSIGLLLPLSLGCWERVAETGSTEVVPKLIDVEVPAGALIEKELYIPVKNTGVTVLQLRDPMPSCGCTSTSIEKKTLLPNESTKIRAKFSLVHLTSVKPVQILLPVDDDTGVSFLTTVVFRPNNTWFPQSSQLHVSGAPGSALTIKLPIVSSIVREFRVMEDSKVISSRFVPLFEGGVLEFDINIPFTLSAVKRQFKLITDGRPENWIIDATISVAAPVKWYPSVLSLRDSDDTSAVNLELNKGFDLVALNIPEHLVFSKVNEGERDTLELCYLVNATSSDDAVYDAVATVQDKLGHQYESRISVIVGHAEK